MGLSGHSHKNPADRVRRNSETYVIDNPVWDGQVRGPALPPGYDWCTRTRKWWKTWRTSPQSMLMTDTDWEWMLETAIIHNDLWNPRIQIGQTARAQLFPELRRRVSAFGASYEDRKKLHMVVDTPALQQTEDEVIETEAKEAVNYVERLAKAAANHPQKRGEADLP